MNKGKIYKDFTYNKNNYENLERAFRQNINLINNFILNVYNFK